MNPEEQPKMQECVTCDKVLARLTEVESQLMKDHTTLLARVNTAMARLSKIELAISAINRTVSKLQLDRALIAQKISMFERIWWVGLSAALGANVDAVQNIFGKLLGQ